MKTFPRTHSRQLPFQIPGLGLGLGLALLAPPQAVAQFGHTFSSSEVARPTLNAVYEHVGGRLVAILETSGPGGCVPVGEAGTGALTSAFRLDARHGAMPSLDGREIRVAGAERTPALEPVFFAGRYDAATLAPIGERQIAVGKDSGYVLTGEVGPDGAFVYRGAHLGRGANLLAKYSADFEPGLGRGADLPRTIRDLGNGSVSAGGRGRRFPDAPPELTGDTLKRWNVFGVVRGGDGSLAWSRSMRASQSGLEQDDMRPVFGPDGAFTANQRRVNFAQPGTDTVGLLRLGKDGGLVYHRTLKVPGATVEGTYHFGEATLVYLTFKEGGAAGSSGWSSTGRGTWQ